MKLSFRLKLFILFIVIILFTAIPIGTVTYKSAYNFLIDNIITSAKDSMIDIDSELISIFDTLKKDTEFIANNSIVTAANESIEPVFPSSKDVREKKYSEKIMGVEGDIYKELESYALTHPEVSYVYIGTRWGGFVQWPDGVPVNGYDPRNRPWYQDALKKPDEVILSDPYISEDEKHSLIVSTSHVIKDSYGSIIGVVGMDITLEKLSEIIRNIKIGTEGYLFMYTEDGKIMTHPNTSLIFKNINDLAATNDVNKRSPDRFSITEYENLFLNNDHIIDTELNNIPVLISTHTSPATGWKMASVVVKGELVRQSSNLALYVALITLMIIVVAIGIAHLSTKIITKPLRVITALMRQVGNGNLSVRSDITSKDEFGQLSTNFNGMIKKLSQSYEELSAVHEELIATDEELRAQYEELQNNEEALRNSEERYRLALDGANDAIWEWNLETGDFFTSDKWYEITGLTTTNHLTIDRLAMEVIHPEDSEKTIKKINDYLKGNTDFFKAEFRIKHQNGSYKWVYCRGKSLNNVEGKVKKVGGSMTDISDRKITEERIRHMAYYDSLTDLPNRTFFMKKLKEVLTSAAIEGLTGAVLFIDLDNFKNINDTLGHDYGDKLLISFSNNLMKLKRDTDIICRFSGDEFIILHPFTEDENPTTYAEEVLKIFSKPFQVGEKQIYITASIGVSLYPKHGVEANTLLKNSDTAMYKAKELGKSTYAFYDNEMYLKLQRRTSIESVLRGAIENNEFILFYQPQFDISNNSISCFEALIRLNSKELGFISPAEFIPIAEETGYIVDIGKWVLKEACSKASQWRKKGYKFGCMGVNISPLQIHQPGFTAMVNEIIMENGLSPEDLELEITETVLMKSLDSNVKILNELRAMGIRIALDDFGTGYSSLNYLKRIPITTLKVDKSFIDNLCSSTKEKAIIESIIQMAHSMELKVVAEGVETIEQLHILKTKHCDKIQGYLFSKPLSAGDAEELME